MSADGTKFRLVKLVKTARCYYIFGDDRSTVYGVLECFDRKWTNGVGPALHRLSNAQQGCGNCALLPDTKNYYKMSDVNADDLAEIRRLVHSGSKIEYSSGGISKEAQQFLEARLGATEN